MGNGPCGILLKEPKACEAAVPARHQNGFGSRAAGQASMLGSAAEVGTAKGEAAMGVRLGCVPGKEHMRV